MAEDTQSDTTIMAEIFNMKYTLVIIFISALLLTSCLDEDTISSGKYLYRYHTDESAQLIHQASGKIVIPQMIVTQSYEWPYIYGVRFQSVIWSCKDRPHKKVTRFEPTPIYYVFDESKGQIDIFEKENETPIEFSLREDFETHMHALGLSRYKKLKHDYVKEWIRITNTTNDRYRKNGCDAVAVKKH